MHSSFDIAPPAAATGWRGRAVATALLALAMAASTPPSAQASDDFHTCKGVDHDAGLSFDAETRILSKSGQSAPIEYKTVERVRLKELSGYCNTKAGRFRFRTEIYGLTLEFGPSGNRTKRRFFCEKSEDATPAAASCDREVKTIDWQSPNFSAYR
jgi:hypothetical protein